MTDRPGPFLLDPHRRELEQESAIDPAVIAERRYESIHRPSTGDKRSRERLQALQIPTWAIKEDSYFPGLLIPMHGPTGRKVSYQWKPRRPVPNRDGKPMKYASPRGQTSRIDVHPRNRDKIADPTVELWITEGVKKGDALTSRGVCTIAITGVFNWRSQNGSLGDWEDVALKGRDVTICFDSDARTNPNVLRAMIRLGNWLRSRGVKQVRYLIVPEETRGQKVKGADNFLAAGGTLEDLQAARTTRQPNVDTSDDTFTDARLAETIADDVLADQYHWVSNLGWQRWDGRLWVNCTDVTVGEAVRQYALDRFQDALSGLRAAAGQAGNTNAIDGWRGMLSVGRERAVLSLARGLVEVDVNELDADPDLLNAPNGVVDLQTGELLPHDPALKMTKITGADYVPGFTHPDWESALEAIPEDVRTWYQERLGQAITGYMTPDDLLIVCHGGGENGKSTVNEATGRAAGSYFLLASDRILLANPDQHPTELMDLQGVRYAVGEETPEARRLAVTRLKKTIGTPRITARKVHKDDVTFDATHSFFLSTNYRPMIEETDHGTWRRLALLSFPYTFRKRHEPLVGPDDRRGDPTLRVRVTTDPLVLMAVLAWMVDGARRWYANGKIMSELPKQLDDDTRAWRAEADQILSHIDDRLIFDPNRHIMATDLLDDINQWLEARGHRKWSDKTLAARFGDHDEVARNRVKRDRVYHSSELSRPPGRLDDVFDGTSAGAVPARYWAWIGVRFATPDDLASDKGNEIYGTGRTAKTLMRGYEGSEEVSNLPSHPSQTSSDQEKYEGGATGETHPENTSRTREAGSFQTDRSTRSSDQSEAATNGQSTHSTSGWTTCPNCGAKFLAVGQDICKVCAAARSEGPDTMTAARAASDRPTMALINAASKGLRPHCSDPGTHGIHEESMEDGHAEGDSASFFDDFEETR
jgi:P4 family phage/plasmid primase-like protien